MTFFYLPDGWRDESTEGPYTAVLQTKGPWTICRLHDERKVSLKRAGRRLAEFNSVEDAKASVERMEKRERTDDQT